MTSNDRMHTPDGVSNAGLAPEACPPAVSSPEGNTRWFVMRSTYSRELRAKSLLDECGVSSFVPMRTEMRLVKGVPVRYQVPSVHNLIFVCSTRTFLDDFKRRSETQCGLRYVMDSTTSAPMTVSDRVMANFIRATVLAGEQVTYLDNPGKAIAMGQLVEVACGPMKGIRGYVVRIKRDRRLVVNVEGLIAAATVHMPMSFFRIIDNPDI